MHSTQKRLVIVLRHRRQLHEHTERVARDAVECGARRCGVFLGFYSLAASQVLEFLSFLNPCCHGQSLRARVPDR